MQTSTGVEFTLTCSILEVYRDELRDLLKQHAAPKVDLKIRGSGDGVFVAGLTQEAIHCEDNLNKLLQRADKVRVVSSTQLNQHSSRSHVIFMLTCTQKSDRMTKVGKLNLVDLAGSEKVGKSGSQG